MTTPTRKRNQAFSGPTTLSSDEIVLSKELYRGGYGIVYKGTCRTFNVAIKVPTKQDLTEDEIASFRKEVDIMSQFYHPNVCLFLGACQVPGKIRIVTELMEGSLAHLVFKSKTKYSLAQRMRWAKDAAQGMAWLHGNNPPVIHRDLKMENLLYDKNKRIKIADFGLSDFKKEGLKDDSEPLGSPVYMAPEVLLQQEITEKVDVYSFAIILWELLTQQFAFSDVKGFRQIKAAVCQGFRPPLPPDCPDILADLIQGCWNNEPIGRPSFTQIVERLQAIIERCEELQWRQRITDAIDEENSEGRLFWQKFFPQREAVPWAEFLPNFCQHLSLPIPADLQQQLQLTPAAATSTGAGASSPSSESSNPTHHQNPATTVTTITTGISAGAANEAARAPEPEDFGLSAYTGTSSYGSLASAKQLPDDTRLFLCLKSILVMSDVVTLNMFGNVLGWFGPLEVPHPPLLSRLNLEDVGALSLSCPATNSIPQVEDSSPLSVSASVTSKRGFLHRIEDMLQQSWFHGHLGAAEAEKMLGLSTREAGTFLVRFSNSTKNGFCISKVSTREAGPATPGGSSSSAGGGGSSSSGGSSSGSSSRTGIQRSSSNASVVRPLNNSGSGHRRERVIKHIVLCYHPGQGFKMDGEFYPTMGELLAQCSYKYLLYFPCPGSKYSWLFEKNLADCMAGYVQDNTEDPNDE